MLRFYQKERSRPASAGNSGLKNAANPIVRAARVMLKNSRAIYLIAQHGKLNLLPKV
jgi:hypothetical protein